MLDIEDLVLSGGSYYSLILTGGGGVEGAGGCSVEDTAAGSGVKDASRGSANCGLCQGNAT